MTVQIIELLVPTVAICRAWVAGLITLAGLVPAVSDSEAADELEQRRKAEAAHTELTLEEEEEAVVKSPSVAAGVKHR